MRSECQAFLLYFVSDIDDGPCFLVAEFRPDYHSWLWCTVLEEVMRYEIQLLDVTRSRLRCYALQSKYTAFDDREHSQPPLVLLVRRALQLLS